VAVGDSEVHQEAMAGDQPKNSSTDASQQFFQFEASIFISATPNIPNE